MFTSMHYYALRIVSYLFLVVLLIRKISNIKSYKDLIFVLIYILICQLSMYLLKTKEKKLVHHVLFLIGSILELSIILILSQIIGVTVYFLVYIIMLDTILFYKKRLGFIGASIEMIISICFLYAHNHYSLEIMMFYSGSLIVTLIISLYLRIIESKKNQAQDFYDRLRISEEKLVKANQELESYSKNVEELTLLRERTRVSRELHDSVGHALSTLCIQLKAVQTITEKKPQLAIEMLDHNVRYVENTLENVRRTVRELKPIEFEALDAIITIEEMIKTFSKLTGVKVKMILSKEKWKMTSDQSHHLYRIIQESLSNALRHGKAKNITVNLQFFQDKLYAYIKDDGIGCKEVKPLFGLEGIVDRARSLGGTVEFTTGLGEGFATKITLPKDKIKVGVSD